MLPPQLRQSVLSPRAITLATLALKVGAASTLHARTCWSWRRNDWASHLDPVYHRFSRIRTLKTRAKLLKNLRRRGKFDWDFESKPFFTPQHRLVRFASHWDGSGRKRPWYLDGEDAKKAKEGEESGKAQRGEDGFELSAREKEWRERMEAMRKQIEKDPYETIFGKRFQPFWSPLVPSWMREEMGLPGWPKTSKEAASDTTSVKPEAVKKTVKNESVDKSRAKDSQSIRKDSTPDDAKVKPAQAEESTKSGAYSYATSASWDSWTNKARRVEWDSVSGQTRKYEYDPISNRMVQIEAPKPAPVEAKAIGSASQSVTTSQSTSQSTSKDIASAAKSTAAAAEPKAVNISVKQSSELRKSIPIPPPLSQPSHSIPIGFAKTIVTSVGPVKITAVASNSPKSSALAKLPAKEVPRKEKILEALTADDVRANMGKTRTSSAATVKLTEEKTQLEAILKERDSAKGRMHVPKTQTTQWDQAEMKVMLDRELETLQKKQEKLIKDERGLFHIERQKRELEKLDERIKEVTARVERMSVGSDVPKSTTSKAPALQSSVDRMQSKDLPKVAEPDDAAAHESTEPIEALNGVPKNWAQQAELLQTDRIRRTTSSRPMFIPVRSRWADDMQARKNAYETRKAAEAQADGTVAVKADRQDKLEKANKMLADEVTEQKMMMQAHENRYAHKIRSLRQELEVAYKQSTVHAEKHLERVRYLEQELEKAQKASGGATNGSTRNAVEELKSTAWKLEKAAQKKRDDELVKEVKSIYERTYGIIDTEHRQPQPEKKPDVTRQTYGMKPKQVIEVESDVDLGEALARYEKAAPPYNFSKANLENEIAVKERDFYDAQGQSAQARTQQPAGKRLVDDSMPKLIPTEITKMSAEEAAAEQSKVEPTNEAAVRWAEPPVYKVLAYDSGNDMMSTATTTSNFTGAETPISIPQALSQLYQPARFVPHFAQLQKDGYQVIFGTKDLLVFKKVKEPAPTVVDGGKRPALEDHGLVGPVDVLGSASSVNEESEPGPMRDLSSLLDATLHGTPPSREPEPLNPELQQGFEPEALRKLTATHAATPARYLEAREAENRLNEDEDTEWRHYPRVRRMEQHFTGSRKRWNSNHRRHSKRFEEREKDLRRKHKRSTLRWILGVGIGTATVMYLVGAAAEKARDAKLREEDWARKAEEQRRKWRAW